MREIKRLKSVFVIFCLIVFIFGVISIGASVESINHQAPEVDTNTDTDDDGLMDTFEDSIEQGISYLFSTRKDPHRKRGEFAIFESSNRDMSGEVYIKITFGTPFVYHSLGFVENLPLKPSNKFKIKIMKKDAIVFMKRHKEIDNYDDPNVLGVDTGGAVWRYIYGSYNGIFRRLYESPDIDDTVLMLQALYEHGENIDNYFPTTATDYFIKYQLRDDFVTHKNLIPPEQLQFNSFNTWILDQNHWPFYKIEAYDAVVNANVLFFYSTQLTTSELQNQIPEVFDYINYASDKMNENRQNAIFPGPIIHSSWAGTELFSGSYPGPFTFTYFVSRAYKDSGAPITGNPSIDINKIKDYILADDDNDGQLDRQKTDGSWGNFELIEGTKALVTNDFETALATLSLLNIYDTFNESDKVTAKTAIDKSIEYLLENQNPDGSWDIAFWGWAPPPAVNMGSAEITTGFVLEALAKYQAIN
jgi:hypothetical protein